MTPDAFISNLAKAVPPFVVCTGEEAFFKEEVLAAVRAALAREEPGLQAVLWEPAPGESEAGEVRRLLSELQTPGLFSPRKLIVVRHGDRLLKAAAKELAELLDAVPEANTVCVLAGKIDGRTSLARRLKALGALVECRPLRDQPAFFRGSGEASELARWITDRGRRYGLDLDPEAAGFLASLTGNCLFLIDSELQKLALGAEEGASTGVAEIEASTGMSAAHTPFELWEQIERGQSSAALQTLGVILRNGLRSVGGALVTDAGGVSAILLKIFRDRVRLAAAALVLRFEGLSGVEAQKALGVSSAFYFRKIQDYARRLDARRYAGLHGALIDAERRMKRLGQMPVPVLEETVVNLARWSGDRS